MSRQGAIDSPPEEEFVVTMRMPLIALVMVTATLCHAQLSYVERSVGLHTIDMEEGNTEIEFGDVNHDGHPDIVCIGDHGSPWINADEHGVMVWFNDGAGNWTIYQNGSFGYGGVALGDVNNDGHLDVGYGFHHDYFAQGDFGDQLLEVALGDGTGQVWTPWDDGLAENGEDWGMFGTDFADVDNDGDLDVGSASFGGSNGARIYLNNSDGTWTQSSALVGGYASIEFTFGDVNGDGHADYAAAAGSATIRLGDGTGSFTVGDGNLPGDGWRRGIDLGDVNADGHDDLAFVTDSGGLAVYAMAGPNVWQSLTGNLPSSGTYDFAQIADMDLDGFGDVLAYGAGNPARTRVYLGDGAGNWTLAATITHPEHDDYAAFRAGVDIDHNGYPDFGVVGKEYVGGFPFPWRNRLRVYAESTPATGPFIHAVYPRGGETWWAGSVRMIDWHAAVPDGAGNPTVALELSTTGAAGPFEVIASEVPNSGRYQWLVPADTPSSSDCYLRLTLQTDPPVEVVTPAAFTIVNPNPLTPGDMNCDGAVDFDDITPFVLALSGQAGFEAAYPDCYWLNADTNGDGAVDFDDITPFVNLIGT